MASDKRNTTGQEPHIKDSGERREFATGAVRDIQAGKGRCDLLPLDVVCEIGSSDVLQKIIDYQSTGSYADLIDAVRYFVYERKWDYPTMFLDLAKHFEEGAKKYGEYNWQRGIPINCYIDSAIRHYLKWLRGDSDEPHDRAFAWNIICCIWTIKHIGAGENEKK